MGFQLHPDSVVFDAGTPGFDRLIDCLRAKRTIRVDDADRSLETPSSADEQWLECSTAGSTGQPKTIRRSAQSWIASFELSKTLFACGPGDHYAVLGKLSHSLSLFATLEALHLGADLSLLGRLPPASQLTKIAEGGVTIIYATPTQLRQFVHAFPRLGSSGFDSVRHILVGGGVLFAKEKENLAPLFPKAKITEFFGTSETSFITLADATTPKGSVGRAYPAVEISIAPMGKDAPGVGEILVRSPYLATGYVGQGHSPLIRPDGFVSTGEVGFLDAEGFLHLKGRKDRMITVADQNVFPEAIENVVSAIPGVTACVVIAIPDDQRGHKTVCFLEVSLGPFDLSQARRACRDRLGPAHVPKEFRVLDKIPLLASGKPDLQTLTSQALVGA